MSGKSKQKKYFVKASINGPQFSCIFLTKDVGDIPPKPKSSDAKYKLKTGLIDTNSYYVDYYSWMRDYGESTPSKAPSFSCYLGSEASCCGFTTLQGFVSTADQGLIKDCLPEAGTLLKKFLDAHNVDHCTAYVPDQIAYEMTMEILAEAGFKPTLSTKSKHGAYTNTRWEWYSPTFKVKVTPNEKTVSALASK